MNLLADESADRPIVERLRADNHSVVYVAELDLGVGDDVMLERANHGGDHRENMISSESRMQEICTSGSMSGDWKRSHVGE